jgi:hypothetical protein
VSPSDGIGSAAVQRRDHSLNNGLAFAIPGHGTPATIASTAIPKQM